MHGYTKKLDCTTPPPYHSESRALKRPVPAASIHSTVNLPSTHTGPRDLLQGRHGHRLEEGALGYSNMKTYRRLQMLTSFLPRFLPGATTQERTSVLMVTPPTVTWSPVQPRSLDFVQPGVGLLSGFHLDGAAVTGLTVTDSAPPGGGLRGNILFI